MQRRAFIRALLIGGGAALWTSCTSGAPPLITATASSTRPATPTRQATPASRLRRSPTPHPSPSPTVDVSAGVRAARRWFPVGQVIGTLPINRRIGGQPVGEGLVAEVEGRERVVAVTLNGEWTANVPRPAPSSADLPSEQLEQAQRELAAQGYGIDLRLEVAPSGEPVGVPETGGTLRRDPWGNLHELPVPADARPLVRWMGRDWVGGYARGDDWTPDLPTFIEGNEPQFAGTIMFTADDCHNPEETREFLTIVEEMGIPITLYPVTPNLWLYPDIWPEVLQAGHEIGYHTTLHSHGDWSQAYLEEDFTATEQVIHEVTGNMAYHIRTVRPPFGLYDYGGWQPWVESKGLTTAMWDRSVGWDAWERTILSYLEEYHSLILLAHPDPDDLAWLEQCRGFLEGLKGEYTYKTVSEALLSGSRPVPVEGIPAGWVG